MNPKKNKKIKAGKKKPAFNWTGSKIKVSKEHIVRLDLERSSYIYDGKNWYKKVS